MNKIKHYPDVALLILRVVTGIGILVNLYPYADYMIKNGVQEIPVSFLIQATIFLVAAIFLIVGFLTRWTTTVLVVTIVVVSFQRFPPIGELTFPIGLNILLAELTNIMVPLAVWLMGPGKYALDYRMGKRLHHLEETLKNI